MNTSNSMDDFSLWMKTRYLLKNLDEETLGERQNELLDVLGGLRRILSIFIDSLPRSQLLSLCNLLYPSQPAIDMSQINTSLESLPDEMMNLVCNYLNVIDLKNLQLTCCQFAIISRQQLSISPAIISLNNSENKKEILSLISSETNIQTKFLHLSSLISKDISNEKSLIKHGIISKLVEFIKYDNKIINFKYKYESMKLLIELSKNNIKYLQEICFGCNVLSSFYKLCSSDPVSKLLHYTSNTSTECNLDLNKKNDQLIMETDDNIINAFRWDIQKKKWRNVCDVSCDDMDNKHTHTHGKGKVCVYQNIATGLHKFMFISSNDGMSLLQYIDNICGVTWNRNDYSIYWRGDDYKMHTNGTWKFIFNHNQKPKYIQQAIQLYDCFTTYSCADNQSVGAKIITQLDSNNIFDHFYWLTNNLQTQIINVIEETDQQIILKPLYDQILYTIKNNRNDEIKHIVNCGLINKIILYITPYSNNICNTKYAIKILLLLIKNDANILQKYDIISIFYNILISITDDCEIIEDIIEAFGEISLISTEWRNKCIEIGFLQYIFNNVLEYNAIIQSVCVSVIYKYFKYFTTEDNDNNLNNNQNSFQQIDTFIDNIPLVLISLYDSYDDDLQMQKQLLLIVESFCDGTNSEYRSRIIVNNGCLKYIGNLLSESLHFDLVTKKNFDIESLCIRITGNVLCDCIWSDFEDKTFKCLDEIKYLQIIQKLFTNVKLSRDILWSLSNILISNKGISWVLKYKQIIYDIIKIATNNNINKQKQINLKIKYDAGWCLCNAYRHSTKIQKNIFLKCGFQNVLLSLIGIHKFDANQKKSKKIIFLMQQIVKSTLENDKQIKFNTKPYESQLKRILQRQTDKTYINNFKKILDIIQSGYIG